MIERLLAALRLMTPEDPYDIDQDCRWCTAHIYQPHEVDCCWRMATELLDCSV